MKRYYSSLRPIGPGTYPKDGAQDIHNYDNRQYIEDAGCECWGYIDYNRELTPEELKNFELVQGGSKHFGLSPAASTTGAAALPTLPPQ